MSFAQQQILHSDFSDNQLQFDGDQKSLKWSAKKNNLSIMSNERKSQRLLLIRPWWRRFSYWHHFNHGVIDKDHPTTQLIKDGESHRRTTVNGSDLHSHLTTSRVCRAGVGLETTLRNKELWGVMENQEAHVWLSLKKRSLWRIYNKYSTTQADGDRRITAVCLSGKLR